MAHSGHRAAIISDETFYSENPLVWTWRISSQ